MGGSSFPSYGKSPAAAAALGKPSLKQATGLSVPSPFARQASPGIPKGPAMKPSKVSPGLMRPLNLPKTRTAFHTNTAIPRGHVVSGALRGPR